jgi:hypothetical protein
MVVLRPLKLVEDDTRDANEGTQIMCVDVELASDDGNPVDPVRVVFCGDANEKTTLAAAPEAGACHLLYSCHHGSSTHGSNSNAWLTICEPKSVLIPCGLHSRYRHPHSDAVLRMLRLATLRSVAEHTISMWATVATVDAQVAELVLNDAVAKVEKKEQSDSRVKVVVTTTAAVHSTVDERRLAFDVKSRALVTTLLPV